MPLKYIPTWVEAFLCINNNVHVIRAKLSMLLENYSKA